MASENLLNQIKSIEGIQLEINKDMSSMSTMKLLATANLIIVKLVSGIQKLLPLLNANEINYRVLGLGANQLLDSLGESSFYIKLDLPFCREELSGIRDVYDLPASININLLTAHAIKHNLVGWDVFTGVPATLGGAIFMNAGTNAGDIGEIVKSVTIINKSGEIQTIETSKNSFKYRKYLELSSGDIIISAKLIHRGTDRKAAATIKKYLNMRNLSQPVTEKTCGCVFKNSIISRLGQDVTCRAGKSIDIIGLKGFTLDGVKVSSKHANFFENIGNADKDNVMAAIKFVQDELELQYGVRFELEVCL